MTGLRARPRSSGSCARSRLRPRQTSVFACCWGSRTAWRASTRAARSRTRRRHGESHPRWTTRTQAPSRSYLQGQCADLLLDHVTALDAFDAALDGFEKARDEGAVAKTLRAISFVHDALGDPSRALDYQFRALAIDQRTGNDSSRAATLRMIGVVYSRTGDAASGLDFYRRSLALCTLPGDAIERGKTLNNIGINLKNLGQLAEAEEALGDAYRIFVGLGLPLQQCATLNNLALVQERNGDLATAEGTMREALALSEATGYRYGVAHASLGLGRLCLVDGRYDESHRLARCCTGGKRAAQSQAHAIRSARGACRLLREDRRPDVRPAPFPQVPRDRA